MLRLGWAETKIHISRAAGETSLASATRGGSCAHPDQSRGLAHRHNMRAISGVGASTPILLFFLGGGVALHERLVGEWKNEVSRYRFRTFNREVYSSNSLSVIVSHDQKLSVLLHRKQCESTMRNRGEK